MLHKLALAVADETPSLIKEALPTPAQDAAIKARLEQKELALAEARGHTIPVTEKVVGETPTGKPVTRMAPDTSNMRLNERAVPGKQVITENLSPNIQGPRGKDHIALKNPGGHAYSTRHTLPSASVSPGHSALIEGELQRSHGTVANNPLKQMRHSYWGGAKRFLGGKGLFGNKWGNRGAVLAGIAALGVGTKAYMDSNKEREPEAPYPAEPTDMEQQWLQQQGGYPKMGADKYSPDAVTIPKPTPQPTVKALGPGTNSLTGPSGAKGGLLGGGFGSSSGTSGGSSSGASNTMKSAEDAGVLPLLGAAAGGAGGFALGTKFLAPALDQKAATLAAEIAKQQAKLRTLQKATSAAPMGAAAAGAILLAALAALYAKRDTKKGPVRQVRQPQQKQETAYNPYSNFYG